MSQQKFWLKIIGLSFLLHVVLIICSVIEVTIYSYLINPGHEQSYYQRHAELSGPWVSGVLGSLFVFLIVRRYLLRHEDRRLDFTLALPLLYIIMDVIILLPFQINWKEHLPVLLAANGAKLAASILTYLALKNKPAVALR
ncbi:MAG: hypothetical protein EOO04_10145 [Chitinophagaceae bacterium]|nr:MAG: hypothetical protein EOO04_10145 [Chitinophagaceae bacterium]